MLKLKLARPMLVALAACAASVAFNGVVFADDAQTQALKDQMRIMQQQMQDLQKQIDSMAKQPTPAPSGPPGGAAPSAGKAAKEAPSTEPKFDKFLKGFYGTLDASVDYTTKGMSGLVAYPYGYASGAPGSPFVITGGPKAGPYGRVGWLGAMSSNGSNVGYRGTHKIGTSDVDFIYQVSTAINMVAAPGLQNTWTKSSNTVQGAIGLGDTYLGFQGKSWGKLKFGEMFMPYKNSTDRLNPFGTGLGNYAVIMGNTGGDNRVEFGTRSDDVVAYSSPTWAGFSFDAAYAFGQQIDPYNNLAPLGSPDCAGSNNPGSGNLPLNCDDGGYNQAFSADLKFEMNGLYLVGAYELHKRVSRASDGIGSNNPYYGYLLGQGNGVSPLLDWNSYNAYAAEYPGAAAAGSPGYTPAYDTADEWAMKFGGQYSFDFGFTVSALWEEMHRQVPQVMEFQNERQRTGTWLALQQQLNGGADVLAAGWAHAGATPGDPGGQHNFNPNGIGNNQANMYTVQWWHKLDKQLTIYFDAADTVNDGNAHYDIGAGGHGIKTDCHDATHFAFVDYSSAGPTTWGGCHEIGVSTGVSYKF
ncbi:MAG: porin [Steroidobacteraceae bacterium]